MNYYDGQRAMLGDTVRLPVPGGDEIAQIVMLGDSREHLNLDESFLEWVSGSDVLARGSVVVKWLGQNPFAHSSPEHAPVGGYMFSALDEFVTLVSRAVP